MGTEVIGQEWYLTQWTYWVSLITNRCSGNEPAVLRAAKTGKDDYLSRCLRFCSFSLFVISAKVPFLNLLRLKTTSYQVDNKSPCTEKKHTLDLA